MKNISWDTFENDVRGCFGVDAVNMLSAAVNEREDAIVLLGGKKINSFDDLSHPVEKPSRYGVGTDYLRYRLSQIYDYLVDRWDSNYFRILPPDGNYSRSSFEDALRSIDTGDGQVFTVDDLAGESELFHPPGVLRSDARLLITLYRLLKKSIYFQNRTSTIYPTYFANSTKTKEVRGYNYSDEYIINYSKSDGSFEEINFSGSINDVELVAKVNSYIDTAKWYSDSRNDKIFDYYFYSSRIRFSESDIMLKFEKSVFDKFIPHGWFISQIRIEYENFTRNEEGDIVSSSEDFDNYNNIDLEMPDIDENNIPQEDIDVPLKPLGKTWEEIGIKPLTDRFTINGNTYSYTSSEAGIADYSPLIYWRSDALTQYLKNYP